MCSSPALRSCRYGFVFFRNTSNQSVVSELGPAIPRASSNQDRARQIIKKGSTIAELAKGPTIPPAFQHVTRVHNRSSLSIPQTVTGASRKRPESFPRLMRSKFEPAKLTNQAFVVHFPTVRGCQRQRSPLIWPCPTLRAEYRWKCRALHSLPQNSCR